MPRTSDGKSIEMCQNSVCFLMVMAALGLARSRTARTVVFLLLFGGRRGGAGPAPSSKGRREAPGEDGSGSGT